jgi:hypothetical protein
MKRWSLWIILCILTAAAGTLLFLLSIQRGTAVEIVQDGNLLFSFELTQTDDRTIEAVYNGRRNVIEVAGGRIRMLEAECPDLTCVRMGYLGAFPIVCLPNRLVIRFTGGSG